MEISKTLKSLRVDAELTQQKLADMLEIGQSTIVGYEKGEREATVANLIKYAKCFSVSLDYICGLEDDIGVQLSPSISNIITPSSSKSITNDEQQLLALYRKMSKSQKNHFIGFGEGLLDNASKSRENV